MKLRLQRRQILALGAALGAAWACGEVAVSPGPAIPQKGLKPARNLRALADFPRSIYLTSSGLFLYSSPSIRSIPRDGGAVREILPIGISSFVLARGRIVFYSTIGVDHYAVDSVEVDGTGLKRIWDIQAKGRTPEMSGKSNRVAWIDPNSTIWALDGDSVIQLPGGPAQDVWATDLGAVWSPRTNDPKLQGEYRITSWTGVETVLAKPDTYLSTLPVVAVRDVLLVPQEDAFFRLRPGGLDRYMAYPPGSAVGGTSAHATDGKTLVFSSTKVQKDPYVSEGSSVWMVNPFRPNDPAIHIFDTKAGVSEIAYDDRGMAWIEVTFNQEKTASYTLMIADFA